MLVQAQMQSQPNDGHSFGMPDRQNSSMEAFQQHQSTPRAKLLNDLRRQVDYYFSPYNFANDTYLQQFTAAYGGYVPLTVISGFPKVREIFAAAALPHHGMTPQQAEMQLLKTALVASEFVEVSHDGLWISPKRHSTATHPPPISSSSSSSSTTESTQQSSVSAATKAPRTTVIVRDLPLKCNVADVVAAFSTESMKPKSAKPDVGNTWYITFETENQAMEALDVSQHRKIDGHPIKARLKSELYANPSATESQPRDATFQRRRFVPEDPTAPYAQQYQQQPFGAAFPQHSNGNYPVMGLHQHQHQHAMMASIPYPGFYPTMNNHGYTPYAYVLPSWDHPQHLMPTSMPMYSASMDDSNSSNSTLKNHAAPSKQKGSERRNSLASNKSEGTNGGKIKQGKRKGNKKKNKNNVTNTAAPGGSGGEGRNDRQGTPEEENPSVQVRNEKRDTSSPTNTNINTNKPSIEKKRSNKNKKKQGDRAAPVKKTLSEENFPSLPGHPKHHTVATPVNGYAQALLKPTSISTVGSTAPSSEDSTVASVQAAVEKLAVDASDGNKEMCW